MNSTFNSRSVSRLKRNCVRSSKPSNLSCKKRTRRSMSWPASSKSKRPNFQPKSSRPASTSKWSSRTKSASSRNPIKSWPPKKKTSIGRLRNFNRKWLSKRKPIKRCPDARCSKTQNSTSKKRCLNSRLNSSLRGIKLSKPGRKNWCKNLKRRSKTLHRWRMSKSKSLRRRLLSCRRSLKSKLIPSSTWSLKLLQPSSFFKNPKTSSKSKSSH